MLAQGPITHFAVWDRSHFKTIVASTRLAKRSAWKALEDDGPPEAFAGFKILEDRTLPIGLCEMRNGLGERVDSVRFL